MKKFILDITKDELSGWASDRGLPAFRAKQISEWINKGIFDPEEMTNLPKDIRTALSEDFDPYGMKVADVLRSKIDDTTKLVLKMSDGNIVETVIMRYSTGLSVCISSQAGCKMGCSFCASAKLGFGRNLTSGEMLGQVLFSQKIMDERIRSVVVMGIGEPFDNMDNLLGFISRATDPDGLSLGARHITVSTCGLIPRIEQFTALKSQVNLAISLHAPNDELRRELMPVASVYGIRELIDCCSRYVKQTGRRISFEYSLFEGVNDTIACAEELIRLLKGMNCHVNLIAANEFPGSPYKRSTRKRIEVFKSRLEKGGINATLRREMGTDIMAACGQLRRGMEEKR